MGVASRSARRGSPSACGRCRIGRRAARAPSLLFEIAELALGAAARRGGRLPASRRRRNRSRGIPAASARRRAAAPPASGRGCRRCRTCVPDSPRLDRPASSARRVAPGNHHIVCRGDDTASHRGQVTSTSFQSGFPPRPCFRREFAGPARLVLLAAAGDRQRVGRHVLGDDAARGDIGAVADRHRRDQRAVRADEGARADLGVVLVEAVVVAGDRAGADVGARADMRVADIGRGGWPWRPRRSSAFLTSTKLPMCAFGADLRAGPQPRERPDDRAGGDRRALDMAR